MKGMEYFKKGAEIEISSDEDGFRGAWFAGTVLKAPVKKKDKTLVLVEYKNIMTDESGSKRLRENVDVVQLRPPPPRERSRTFKIMEEVDAYFNDGWWEGVITEARGNSRFAVFFRTSREQLEFSENDLRLHREWFYDRWAPPLEEEVLNFIPMVISWVFFFYLILFGYHEKEWLGNFSK